MDSEMTSGTLKYREDNKLFLMFLMRCLCPNQVNVFNSIVWIKYTTPFESNNCVVGVGMQ